MNLEEILTQPQFDLPYLFSIRDGLSIDEFKKILVDYKKTIDANSDLLKGVLKEPDLRGTTYIYDAAEFQHTVAHITDKIITALDLYLNGHPYGAYISIHSAITDNNILFQILTRKTEIIRPGTAFYRLRTDDDKYFTYPLTPLQLFHIPFQLRYLLSPQRFSISGYPSLDMAGSLMTACREKNVNEKSEQINKVKAVAFKNIRSIKYIDLSAKDINTLMQDHKILKVASSDDKIRQAIYDYGVLFPLVAACHTKITYPESYAPFKIEYIIPQIILQWIKSNNIMADGIRYFCNGISAPNRRHHIDAYNYVFPVRTVHSNGHCQELKNIFLSSPVLEGKHISFSSNDFSTQIMEFQAQLQASPFTTIA